MPRLQFTDFLPGRSCRFLLHFHYDEPSPKPDDGCPGGPLAYGLGSRFPRPERKLRSELHYFGFQKLSENRTGFFTTNLNIRVCEFFHNLNFTTPE